MVARTLSYIMLTAGQSAALSTLRAAELERLILDQQAARGWQLPVTPHMPVDQYLRLTANGWRLT